MALDFQFPQAQALREGLSQPLPISLSTPRKGDPVTVPVNIAWQDYGASSVNPVAVEVSLEQSASPGLTLDAIRSVYIDNSFSFVPIYVRFPGTQFIIICPANSIGMFPVFVSPGVRKAIIYAQDFDDANIPVTTIHFSNVEVAGWVCGTGEFFPPVPIPSLVRVDTLGATGGGVLQTFAGANLGSEDTSRVIYVGISGSFGATAPTISGVTLDGNAMTAMVSAGTAIAGSNSRSAIYRIADPAGLTGTIAVTWNTAPTSMVIDVFAGYNLTNPLTAFATASAISSNPAANLLTPADGFAMAIGTTIAGSLSGIGNLTNLQNMRSGYQQTTGAALALALGGTGNSSLVGVSVI